MVEGISKVDSVNYMGVSIALNKGVVIIQDKALLTLRVRRNSLTGLKGARGSRGT